MGTIPLIIFRAFSQKISKILGEKITENLNHNPVFFDFSNRNLTATAKWKTSTQPPPENSKKPQPQPNLPSGCQHWFSLII
jgi:hypothetical protein